MAETKKQEEISLHRPQQFMQYLMVLLEIERLGLIDEYFKAVLGAQAAGYDPVDLVADLFTEDVIDESRAMFPDAWETVLKEEQQYDINSLLLKDAEFDQESIDKLPDDIKNYLKTTAVFEQKFPDAEGTPTLAARLAVTRDKFFDALSSENGKQALNIVALGVSVCTGTIATKLGFKAGAWLAGKLADNPSVQAMTSRISDKATSFLEKVGVPTSKIAERYADFKKTAADVINSERFKRYGMPSIMLAGVVMGCSTIGFENLQHAASVIADSGVDGVQATAEGVIGAGRVVTEHVGEFASLSVDNVIQAGLDIESFGGLALRHPGQAFEVVVNGLGDAFSGTAELAVKAYDGTVALASDGIESVANLGHSATERLGEEVAVVSDALSSHYSSIGDAIGPQVDFAKEKAETLAKLWDGAHPFASPEPSHYVAADGSVHAGIPGVTTPDQSVADINDIGVDRQLTTDLGKDSDAPLMSSTPAASPPDVSAPTPAPAPAPVADADVAPSAAPAASTPEAGAPVADVAVAAPSAEVVSQHAVTKGESLWKIAEKTLAEHGVATTNANVNNAVNALYEANKDLIGANPNILPVSTDSHPFVLKITQDVIDPNHVAPVRPLADSFHHLSQHSSTAAVAEKLATVEPYKAQWSREDLDNLFAQSKSRDSGPTL